MSTTKMEDYGRGLHPGLDGEGLGKKKNSFSYVDNTNNSLMSKH